MKGGGTGCKGKRWWRRGVGERGSGCTGKRWEVKKVGVAQERGGGGAGG